MDKNGVITISDWQKGIAVSPLSGFADVRNCEIHNPEGILKIALAPNKISSTTVTGLPTWMTADRVNDAYYFGGYLHTNIYTFQPAFNTVGILSGSSIFTGSGGGIYYKSRLVLTSIAFGTGSSDYLQTYNPTSTIWDNTFADLGSALTSGDVTPMYIATNNTLYIGNGQYVSSLTSPTSSATFTQHALDIFNDYKIDSLSQISTKLIIGASKRYGSVQQDSYEGKLFPWDTTSPSFTNPLLLDQGGVKQLISRNNEITFANGRKGDYFTTNATFFTPVQEIGSIKNNPPYATFDTFPEARAFINNEYLFGISSSNTAYTPAGIYGLKNGAWRFLEISTGSVGASATLNIGVIYPKDSTNFYVGWQDNTSYGIDEFGYSNYRYTGYRARVDSQLYSVGTSLQKKQFTEIEFTLAKPLATGQGIKLSYRTSLNDNFTPIGTYDYSTLGAITDYNAPASILSSDKVQIRIELTTGASSTTSPELIAVRLK